MCGDDSIDELTTLATQTGLVLSWLPSISSHTCHCNTWLILPLPLYDATRAWQCRSQGKEHFCMFPLLSNSLHIILADDTSYSLFIPEHAFSSRTLPSPTANLNKTTYVAITSSAQRSVNNFCVFFHPNFSWLLKTPVSFIKSCLSGWQHSSSDNASLRTLFWNFRLFIFQGNCLFRASWERGSKLGSGMNLGEQDDSVWAIWNSRAAQSWTYDCLSSRSGFKSRLVDHLRVRGDHITGLLICPSFKSSAHGNSSL